MKNEGDILVGFVSYLPCQVTVQVDNNTWRKNETWKLEMKPDRFAFAMRGTHWFPLLKLDFRTITMVSVAPDNVDVGCVFAMLDEKSRSTLIHNPVVMQFEDGYNLFEYGDMKAFQSGTVFQVSSD
jgi:hypothetical protein